MTLEEALAECPAVAIIRGVTPDEAVEVAEALFSAGLRAVGSHCWLAPALAAETAALEIPGAG